MTSVYKSDRQISLLWSPDRPSEFRCRSSTISPLISYLVTENSTVVDYEFRIIILQILNPNMNSMYQITLGGSTALSSDYPIVLDLPGCTILQ